MALGFFAVRHFTVGQFAVKKTEPNLAETDIFPYGELSYGEKSAHEYLYTIPPHQFSTNEKSAGL